MQVRSVHLEIDNYFEGCFIDFSLKSAATTNIALCIAGPPRDCKVSEWSPWAPCSKSCGIGEAVRIRAVLKHPKRGGKPCPPELKEVK